jgi:hypothetical protein
MLNSLRAKTELTVTEQAKLVAFGSTRAERGGLADDAGAAI